MNVQPVSPTNLKLILPSSRNLAIEVFQIKVENIIKKVRTDADRAGTATPAIILFSETSLQYVFNITSDEIQRAIVKMQQKMPSDIDIAVGFSVFEWRGNLPQNRGYLFTSEKMRTSFKRQCTSFDSNALSYANFSLYKKAWMKKGRKMERKQKKFATIKLNNNLRVELRVCFDVITEPIVPKPSTLTIVPAHDIDPMDASSLSENRYKVVINDSGAHGAYGTPATHSNTTYRNTHNSPREIEL